jgi:hypothetical protein
MKPAPRADFGHDAGSHSFSLWVLVSPARILVISWSYQPCIASPMTLVSSARAAVRPSVE